jgi:hypothetical protein
MGYRDTQMDVETYDGFVVKHRVLAVRRSTRPGFCAHIA